MKPELSGRNHANVRESRAERYFLIDILIELGCTHRLVVERAILSVTNKHTYVCMFVHTG